MCVYIYIYMYAYVYVYTANTHQLWRLRSSHEPCLKLEHRRSHWRVMVMSISRLPLLSTHAIDSTHVMLPSSASKPQAARQPGRLPAKPTTLWCVCIYIYIYMHIMCIIYIYIYITYSFVDFSIYVFVYVFKFLSLVVCYFYVSCSVLFLLICLPVFYSSLFFFFLFFNTTFLVFLFLISYVVKFIYLRLQAALPGAARGPEPGGRARSTY